MEDLKVYESVLELMASEKNPTPIVRLRKVNPLSGIEFYAKLEFFNPFGSVKDRIAFNMLEEAEKRKEISGRKLIEPTSGNTGIALNAVANLKGLNVKNTVSSAIPEEKKEILRFLGAELVEVADTLCPDPEEPSGAIGIAKSTAKNFPKEYYMPNQYENEDNWKSHYKTTGPEIWKQSRKKVSHFVAGLGTCGTITGCAKYLKEKNPKVKVIGVAPEEGHNIPGVRSRKQLEVTKLFMPELYEEVVEVSNKEAYEMCLRLNREEGILCGPSSGMAVAGAFKAVKEGEHGFGVIVFPDSIFKYSSFLKKEFPKIYGEEKKQSEEIQLMPPPPEFERNQELEIEPLEAKKWIEEEKPLVLDVRPNPVFLQGHVPKAVNIPLQELPSKIEEFDKNKAVLTICNRGNASYSAMEYLKKKGFKKVLSLKTGTIGWIQQGLEVE